jgi:hypothetical protein
MKFGLVPATDKILRGMNEPFIDNTELSSAPELLPDDKLFSRWF